MISEVENVLKATIVISPEYEAHARKVVVKEANIKPNENGVVPLGKDGAFEHDEEEVLDFIGPSKAGPLQEPKPSDTIEEAPVLTEDPSRLEEVVNPIKEELEKIQNKDVVKEEIKDEAKNEIVSPLGVTMPEIETPIANEPNLDDSSLFSIPGETPEPETVKEPEASSEPNVDLPEMPALEPSQPEPSLEEMLSPKEEKSSSDIPTMSKSVLPAIDSPKSSSDNGDFDIALEDRLIQFETQIKSNLESQIDSLLDDLRRMTEGKTITPLPSSEPQLETMSSAMLEPEVPPMQMQQPMMQPQMDNGMNSMNNMNTMNNMNPGMNSGMMSPMMGPMMQPQSMPAQNPMMGSNMYNNPEPQSIDNGPIQGGGMFIQF